MTRSAITGLAGVSLLCGSAAPGGVGSDVGSRTIPTTRAPWPAGSLSGQMIRPSTRRPDTEFGQLAFAVDELEQDPAAGALRAHGVLFQQGVKPRGKGLLHVYGQLSADIMGGLLMSAHALEAPEPEVIRAKRLTSGKGGD